MWYAAFIKVSVALLAGLHKVAKQFGLNFQGRLNLPPLEGDKILVVIGIGMWIQDRIFSDFFYHCKIGQNCLSAGLHKKLREDLGEIFREG